MCVYQCSQYTHTHMHTLSLVDLTHMYTHVYTHTYTHTLTHTLTHTHSHTHKRFGNCKLILYMPELS